MLNVCAIINTANGLRFSFEKISLNLVSRPMQTKAILNSVLVIPFEILPTSFALSISITKLKTSEAIIKPTTNFGNRSHITPSDGFSWPCVPLYDQ